MNDDKLILYFYKDGLSDTERRDIAVQLERDAALRERYDILCRDLQEIRDSTTATPPPDTVARWHDSIDRAATLERNRARPTGNGLHLPSFAWGTAIAAVLVAGIAIGLYFGSRNQAPTIIDPSALIVETAPESDTGSAFTRGMQVHFRDSRQSIDSLSAASGDDRALLILNIIQQNRLFARQAKQNNTPELARVLRAFEPVLLQLANPELSGEQVANLQSQLAFELSVMLTKLETAPSKEAGNTFESI